MWPWANSSKEVEGGVRLYIEVCNQGQVVQTSKVFLWILFKENQISQVTEFNAKTTQLIGCDCFFKSAFASSDVLCVWHESIRSFQWNKPPEEGFLVCFDPCSIPIAQNSAGSMPHAPYIFAKWKMGKRWFGAVLGITGRRDLVDPRRQGRRSRGGGSLRRWHDRSTLIWEGTCQPGLFRCWCYRAVHAEHTIKQVPF